MLAILCRILGFMSPKHFEHIWLSNISILRLPGDCFSRSASCALNVISTYLLVSNVYHLSLWCLTPLRIQLNVLFCYYCRVLHYENKWPFIRWWRCFLYTRLTSSGYLVLTGVLLRVYISKLCNANTMSMQFILLIFS
jgi:hypothetical protein